MRIHSGLLLVLAALLSLPAAGARFPTPDAARIAFAVDGLHDGNTQPKVAFDASGNFVAVWTRWTADEVNRSEVVVQRFGASGRPRSGRFRVNTYLPDFQAYPVVAMNANGQFAVAWTSYGQDGQIGGIYARAFNARGAAVTAELPVNSSGDANGIPAIGIDAKGGFVVAWYNEVGTYLRRFSAAGAAMGPEAHITSGSNPTLAMAPDGSFLLAWRDWDARTATAHIRGRRFGRAGVPSSVELEINSRPITNSGTPSLASTPDGGFLVAWDRCDYANFAAGCEVRMRRFDAQDEPTTADDVTISPDDHRGHEWPTAAAEPGGYTAVAWQDCALDAGGQMSNCKIETLFFDPAGQPAPAAGWHRRRRQPLRASVGRGWRLLRCFVRHQQLRPNAMQLHLPQRRLCAEVPHPASTAIGRVIGVRGAYGAVAPYSGRSARNTSTRAEHSRSAARRAASGSSPRSMRSLTLSARWLRISSSKSRSSGRVP